MKYRYLGKTYCCGSYELIPLKPGDEWVAEGVVRFHLSAIWSDIEEKPETFVLGELMVSDYVDELAEHGGEDDKKPLTEPVIAVEYGPGDWRVLDGWGRIARAAEEGVAGIPAVKIASEQAMRYLLDEEEVRRFIEHWNFKASYWERRDRVNERLMEGGPEYTEIHADADATWDAILAAASGRGRELAVRWNRWFSIHGDGTKLFIGEAKYMAPSCPLTFDRQIRKKEYLELFPLYEEWEQAADDGPIREKARRITISYEYIFAMIRQFATE